MKKLLLPVIGVVVLLSPVSDRIKLPVSLILGTPGVLEVAFKRKQLFALKDEQSELKSQNERLQVEMERSKAESQHTVNIKYAEFENHKQEFELKLQSAWKELEQAQQRFEDAKENHNHSIAARDREIAIKEQKVNLDLANTQGLLDVSKEEIRLDLQKQYDRKLEQERLSIEKLKSQLVRSQEKLDQEVLAAELFEEELRAEYEQKKQELEVKFQEYSVRAKAIVRKKRLKFKIQELAIKGEKEVALEQIKLEREILERNKVHAFAAIEQEQQERYEAMNEDINRKYEEEDMKIAQQKEEILAEYNAGLKAEQQEMIVNHIKSEVEKGIKPYIKDCQKLKLENETLKQRLITVTELYQKSKEPKAPKGTDPFSCVAREFILFYAARNIFIDCHRYSSLPSDPFGVYIIFIPCHWGGEFKQKEFCKLLPSLVHELHLIDVPDDLKPDAEGWSITLRVKPAVNFGLGMVSPNPVVRQLSKMDYYTPPTEEATPALTEIKGQEDKELMLKFRPPSVLFSLDEVPSDVEWQSIIWYYEHRADATKGEKPNIRDLNHLAHKLYGLPPATAEFNPHLERAVKRLESILKPMGLLPDPNVFPE